MIEQNLITILPELLLAVFAMAALMLGVWRKGSDVLILWLSAGAMALVGLWIGYGYEGTRQAFDGAFVDDRFARFAKVTILLSAAIILLMSQDYLRRAKLMKFEFPVLVVMATIGMMIMVSASDLIALYMGLELQSLALYVVAAFRRDNLKSTEAGLKYFVLGALSSGLLLYGASLVYGFTGTTTFAGIASVVASQEQMSLGLLFGLVFLVVGMAFKVSAVPFHMWTPDVYEGSPTPVTAFFATAPKVAAAAMFARLLFSPFGDAIAEWQQILIFLSVASMYLGAIAAIGQRNIKRLMAYSSIGHMGFALMGLAAGGAEGLSATLLYLAIYVTTNVGVFAFILNMRRDDQAITDIYALGMYSKTDPGRALALAVLMFSLAGLPPLVGFFAKFYVLSAAIDAGLVWFAIAGVIASVISAFYYLRIIYILYFGSEVEPLTGRIPMMHWLFLWGSAAAMVLGVINLFGVDSMAMAAARALM
ncbi:NADH-quinone oxidoreductase subunit NuoN [Abyssibius alkaniclasticus]|uniref:NADH-quinone oxidoreductase subunit NuoN n=1 Tax=Abyssibius alkaniclasticus TaxID=2881234 RepID=UPI0040581174